VFASYLLDFQFNIAVLSWKYLHSKIDFEWWIPLNFFINPIFEFDGPSSAHFSDLTSSYYLFNFKSIKYSKGQKFYTICPNSIHIWVHTLKSFNNFSNYKNQVDRFFLHPESTADSLFSMPKRLDYFGCSAHLHCNCERFLSFSQIF